jgi:hypothetical protein
MGVPKSTEELLLTTRAAAAAFVEDMPHVREVLNRVDPDRGEIRRMSNILRRLLVDKGGDLRDIAAPRIGRFSLLSPDNSPVLKASRRIQLPFYESAGVSAYGVFFRAAMVNQGTKPLSLENFDPEKAISLPMDNFLSQQVICLKGQWASRRDVIKYIANIASGVHSGSPKEPVHHLLNRVRRAARYSAVAVPAEMGAPPGTLMSSQSFNMGALGDGELPFTYSAKDIDPVLVELLAAAYFLAESPDIAKLENHIISELSQGP